MNPQKDKRLNTNTFETYFDKFSTTTVIRVFNFIRTSTFRVEQAFWIVVLVGFSAATAWSVTRTVNTFLAEPTASQLSFGTNVTTGFTFADAVICLQLRSNILHKLYEAKFSDIVAHLKATADLDGYLRAKLEKAYVLEDRRIERLEMSLRADNFVSKDMMELLDSYHAFEVGLKDVFSPNDVALVGMTTALFAHMSEIEMYQKIRQNGSLKLRKLHEAFVARGENFSALLDLTIAAICVLLQVRLSTIEGNRIASKRFPKVF